jgi:hypothetical protein
MRVMILQEKPPSSGTLSPPEKVRPEILHYHYCNLDLDYVKYYVASTSTIQISILFN